MPGRLRQKSPPRTLLSSCFASHVFRLESGPARCRWAGAGALRGRASGAQRRTQVRLRRQFLLTVRTPPCELGSIGVEETFSHSDVWIHTRAHPRAAGATTRPCGAPIPFPRPALAGFTSGAGCIICGGVQRCSRAALVPGGLGLLPCCVGARWLGAAPVLRWCPVAWGWVAAYRGRCGRRALPSPGRMPLLGRLTCRATQALVRCGHPAEPLPRGDALPCRRGIAARLLGHHGALGPSTIAAAAPPHHAP